MFTGIIENLGKVIGIVDKKANKIFTIESTLTNNLKVDQSISHNGVCLTIIEIDIINNQYKVEAISETLNKTSLNQLEIGSLINLERGLTFNARLDGHIVQGHIDCVATCSTIENQNGSYLFSFQYISQDTFITVEKGSICVNGVSLTVVNSQQNSFSVAIIPFTFENTNFKQIKIGTKVNLEFDIVGKYIDKLINKN